MHPTELLSQLQVLRASLLAGTAGVFFVGNAHEGKDTMDGYLTFGMFDARKGTMTEDFTEVVKFAELKGTPSESFSMSVRTARSLYATLQHNYQPGEAVLVGVHASAKHAVAVAVNKAGSGLSPLTYTAFEAAADLLKDGDFLTALDEAISALMRMVSALTVSGSRLWKRLLEATKQDEAAARREMAILLYNQSKGLPRLQMARSLCDVLGLPGNAHNCAMLDRDLRELEQVSLDDAWIERLAARIELDRGTGKLPLRVADVFELRGAHA